MAWDFLVSVFLLSVPIPAKKAGDFHSHQGYKRKVFVFLEVKF